MTEGWLAVLQFADGLFPAGGFAHSLGLETYVQDGVVADRAGLEAFVTAHLEGSAGPADAVAVAVAVRLAASDDVAGWVALDERVDAMKAVPELRAASRQMGRQTLRVAATLGADSFLTAVERAAVDGLDARPSSRGVRRGARPGRRGAGARGRCVSLHDGGHARRCGAAAASRWGSSTASARSPRCGRASCGWPRRRRWHRRRRCGPSILAWSWRPSGTPRSTRGCSARELDPRHPASAQGRHRGARRLGQDRARPRCSAGGCATRSRWRSSPTTSTRRKTPSSSCVAARWRAERVIGVETGGCPHTAIREDASVNLEAIGRAGAALSGSRPAPRSRAAATIWRRPSVPSWSTPTIYVIDVAEGEKIPRKGGPGITRSEPAGHQQDRSGSVRGRRSRRDGARCAPDARRAPVRVHQPQDRRGRRRDRPLAPDRAAADPGVAGPLARVGRDGALRLAFERRAGASVLTASRSILPLQVLAPIALDGPAAIVSTAESHRRRARRRPAVDRRHARRGRPRVRDHALGDSHLSLDRRAGRPDRAPASGSRGDPRVGPRPHDSVRRRGPPAVLPTWRSPTAPASS